MYTGYLRLSGSVEVINCARTMAYVAAGYGAAGVDYQTPVAYDGLAEALGEVYRTPVLDGAPWYDEDRPDTHGFAGVLPLDITGLDGTTSVAEVVESIGAGGVAQKARRTTRTIPVQALLVGDSSEAIDAGLRWLTTVLHRTCEPDALPFEGAQLDGFTVLPSGYIGQEDLDAALVDTAVLSTDPGWRGYGGAWHPDTGIFQVEEQAGEAVEVLDGGGPWTGTDAVAIDGGDPDGLAGTGDDTDGGDPDDPGAGFANAGGVEAAMFDGLVDGGFIEGESPESLIDGGGLTLALLQPYARLVAPVALSCLSRVVVTWTLTPTDGEPVIAQVGATDVHGTELHREPAQTITAETEIVWEWEWVPWEEWAPAVWVAAPGVQVAVSVASRPFLDPEVCLSPLRRTYSGLTCVAGPTPVATHVADDCDDTKLMQVEWTWVAGNPYRYGAATTLLAGLDVTDDTAAVANAAGVSYANEAVVAAAGLVCAAPVDAPSCGFDPSYPGFVAPPAAPVISDPGATNPTDYHRRVITLDPAVVPDAGVLALRWTLANPAITAKRGIRVRLWRQTDPDFATHTECDFESEMWINYIDAGATLLIDGIAGTVTAVCDDDSLAPARGVMRGPYRGAFEFPTVACDGSYFIAVDTPSTMADLMLTLEAAPQEY